MAPPTTDDITANVSKLSLKTSKAPKKKAPVVVADSWEDEDLSSGSEAEATKAETTGDAGSGDDARDRDETLGGGATRRSSSQVVGTSAPPPTPISPTTTHDQPFPAAGSSAGAPPFSPYDGAGGPAERRRPEKTDAVARRMIASALGVKVKLTDEQRAYDKAMRDKERRRIQDEKELARKKAEEAAKAKQAIWDD